MRGDTDQDARDRLFGDDEVSHDAVAAEGSYSIEETLLTKHDVRAVFRRLPLVERVVVALLQRYAAPPGYTGPWPATPEQVGDYLRATFPQFRRGISARMVVRLNRIALRRLRTWLEQGGAHHGL